MELHGKATVVLDLQLIKSSFLSVDLAFRSSALNDQPPVIPLANGVPIFEQTRFDQPPIFVNTGVSDLQISFKSVSSIPEPSSILGLLAFGGLGLGMMSKKAKK